MEKLRRSSVFVALHGTIRRELVFRHHTNKVVVARYPDISRLVLSEPQRRQKNRMMEANQYAQQVLQNPMLYAMYEKYLQHGESVYRKAIKEYFERVKK
jgi:hypothetical protein